MKMVIVAAATILLVGLTPGVWRSRSGKRAAVERSLAALEQKMLGVWQGRIGCDGRLIFRADGTYELKDYGPGQVDLAGIWKVRWDALPATLILICKTSQIPCEVGKTMEVKLLKLDDNVLDFEYAEPNGNPSGQYTREKK